MGVISVHIHPPTQEFIAQFRESLERMSGSLQAEAAYLQPRPIEELIADMDGAGIEKAVLLPIDARARYGEGVSNDHIADLARRYPTRLIGFCSVDPHMGREAIKELERSVKKLNLRGLKLDGTKQDFCPADKMAYPLYENSTFAVTFDVETWPRAR